MVHDSRPGQHPRWPGFQYSLCRVVLMVNNIRRMTHMFFSLSVLALSSRFDGPARTRNLSACGLHFQYSLCRVVLMVVLFELVQIVVFVLSVLALSSRFDGRCCPAARAAANMRFQYSLCRVVLMV